jgi:hypothetical protein
VPRQQHDPAAVTPHGQRCHGIPLHPCLLLNSLYQPAMEGVRDGGKDINLG